MAIFLPDPTGSLFAFQEALESLRASGWLGSSPSGAGSFPPINVFRKGDDFVLLTELPGIKKGIRIGSAKTGQVTAFIEDMESTTPEHSGAEGIGVDSEGNVYGGVVRRRMLERHVKK